MAFFTRSSDDSRLYLGPQQGADEGHVYMVLPRAGAQEGYELAEALFDASLAATFAFSPLPAPVDGSEAAAAFVSGVTAVAQGDRAYVWLRDPDPRVFAPDGKVDPEKSAYLGIASSGKSVSFGLARATIIPSILSLSVAAGMVISLDPGTTTVVFSGSDIRFNFSGSGQLNDAPAETGRLDFAGALRGVFQWDTTIPRINLRQQLSWGFQFLIPVDLETRDAIHEYLPFASGTSPAPETTRFAFHATVDPADPRNLLLEDPARTALTFTGLYADGGTAVLDSCYRTVFGDLVQLRPVGDGGDGEQARLVFSLGELTQEGTFNYLTSPHGDFLLSAPDAAGEVTDLLAGLEGSEYISFRARPAAGAEDRLRFRSRQPAYAPAYPFPRASPTGPPTDPEAPLLTGVYLTSWGVVLQADGTGAHYVAQPRGSNLFGRDESRDTAGDLALLWASDIGYRLPAETVFPLPPYAAVEPGNGVVAMSRQQVEKLEREALSPTRRNLIGAPTTSASRQATLLGEAADATTDLTTPSGVLARVTTSGGVTTWQSIVLGQNRTPDGKPLELGFQQPAPELQQVFQTNSLMLVAANACYLGELEAWRGKPWCPDAGGNPCSGFPPSAGSFANRINVEDWILAANVGVQNRYNDYRNVLLVKGRKGKLWDPTDAAAGLVQNPDLWTQRGQFASPSYLAPRQSGAEAANRRAATSLDEVEEELLCPDPNQQVILSQWLDSYFLEASRQTSEYFAGFNTIAQDENWTGILVLRADITQLPEDLVGILAGVRDLTSFNAHHVGVNITPVDGKTVSSDEPSSIFGLIYYQDPEYDLDLPETPVQPTAGETYDFVTLSLNVLFENSAVKDFRSYTQLTLNEFFAQRVTEMGGAGANRFNSVILRGSFQRNGDQTVYSMGTQTDDLFGFDANLLQQVEVDGVQMSTRDPAAGEEELTVTWFALTGFLDFAVVTYEDLDCAPPEALATGDPLRQTFDVLSFGSKPDKLVEARRGLSYSSLGLRMTFRVPETGQTELPEKSFQFVTDEIFFNVDVSTPRSDSLFTDFALDLVGLVSGGGEETPSSLGYLPVTTAAPLTGVDGAPWFGLRYKLDLGSPGALAGEAGLNSYLLVAWSPESRGSGYKAAVAIQLPGTGGGAKLISLQNVLKLSIGQIWLNRANLGSDETADPEENRAWLLLFNEIALKFLGLVKIPPGGTSTFYLYGNPKRGDAPSGLGWYAIYKSDQSGGGGEALPAVMLPEGE